MPINRKRRRAAAAAAGSAAASLALLAAGCASSPAASAHDSATTALTLTVSDQLADFQPLLEASGLFSGLSYHLDFSVLNGSAALLSALASDKIDVGAAGDNSAAFEVANESQTPTRSLLAYQGIAVTYTPKSPNPAPTIYATKASGITSLNGLKGKTIGYNAGATVEAGYVAALAKAGLTAKDVKGVEFPSSQAAAAAFDAGDLDAVVSAYPYVSQPVSEGKAEAIAGPTELGVIGGAGWLATTPALGNPAKAAAIKDFFSRLRTFYLDWYPTHAAEVEHVYETVDDETPTTAKLQYTDAQHTQFYDVGSAGFLSLEQTGVDNAYRAGELTTDRSIDVGYNNLLGSVLGSSS